MIRARLLVLVCSVLVSLGLVEVGLRAANLGLGNSPIESDPYLHHVHPKNYTFVQQHPSGELGGFTISYDEARRVVRSLSESSASTGLPCRIAFMGDSFTEAGQVPYDDGFVAILAKRAEGHCEVRNYGVRSYSPAIYLVQWTRDVSAWQPTHVFVLLFGNDVADDLGYLQTADLDANGLPTAIHGPTGGWLTAQLRKLYIARYIRATEQKWEWSRAHAGQPVWTVGGQAEENPDWADPSARLVRELHRRVTATGAQFTLMTVPSRYRLMGDGSVPVGALDFHQKIEQWASQEHIPFLPIEPAFAAAPKTPALYFLQDIHFTEAGHHVAAEAITQARPELFPAR